MAKLIYVSPMSLDGYISDKDYEWSPPDEQGFAFITDILRPIGTYLYGRKLYETMSVWQTMDRQDFGHVWRAADKIVYSKSLQTVSTPKTRIDHEFDLQSIRALKAQSPHDIAIGGPTLAAQAIQAGLVDEYHLFLAPFILGGGIQVLPSDVRIKLNLLDERRFPNGMLCLRYQPTGT